MSRRGHTQASLGGVLDVSHRAVGKWLAGDSRPGPAVALKIAEHFGVSIDGLLDDEADLPADETERRYAEAKGVAEHYPDDNQTARQLAFEKHLERSSFAKTLRDTAKRLRGEAARLGEEAEQLDKLADGIHIPTSPATSEIADPDRVTPAVAAKVAESRRLYAQQQRRRAAEDPPGAIAREG